MTREELDDHIPAPPGKDAPKPRKDETARRAAGRTPSRWGDRLLFAALGVLVGFTGAYVSLEKTRTPAAAQARNPHAGLPGFDASGAPVGGSEAPGVTGPAVDATARKRLADLQAAAAKAPDNYETLVQLGNAAYDVNEPRQAIDAYEKALKLKDGDPNVMTDLGVCYRGAGEVDKALAMFEKALKVKPDHWQALYNEVVVNAFDKKDMVKARELFQRLKKEHPELSVLEPLGRELGTGG